MYSFYYWSYSKKSHAYLVRYHCNCLGNFSVKYCTYEPQHLSISQIPPQLPLKAALFPAANSRIFLSGRGISLKNESGFRFPRCGNFCRTAGFL